MRTQHVVGYELITNKFGTYYKGQDGTICLPNPRDQRPSRMIFVKKVPIKEEQQLSLTDYKIPQIINKEKFRKGQIIIYTPRRSKEKIRAVILEIYKTTFGSKQKDKALRIGLFAIRNGRKMTTIRTKYAKVMKQ
jgi:hypothetical protein